MAKFNLKSLCVTWVTLKEISGNILLFSDFRLTNFLCFLMVVFSPFSFTPADSLLHLKGCILKQKTYQANGENKKS